MSLKDHKYFHWLVVFNVSLGTLSSTIDSSSVNVALPTIAAELGTGMGQVQWITTAYLLTIAALMLVSGRVTDMLGKRVYCLGYLFFALGALLCSLANSLPQLIIFRMVEGLGASIIMANSFGLIAWASPPNQRGKLMGMFATVAAIGTLSGPSFGGIIIGAFGWRANFYLGAGIGTLGLIQAFMLFRNMGSEQVCRDKFDLLGAGLFATAMVSLLLAFDSLKADLGRMRGWNFFIATVILFSAFIWRQTRAASPLLNLRLFQLPAFWTGLTARMLNFMINFFMIFLMPFYLHDLHGFNPAQVGLMMTAFPVGNMAVSGLSGWLSDRYGSQRLTVVGQVVGLAASIYLASISATTAMIGIVLRIGLMGLSTGIFQSPNNTALLEKVPHDQMGTTGSLLPLVRTIGQVLGVAIAATLFTSLMSWLGAGGMEYNRAFSQSIQTVFWVGVGLRMLGLTLLLYGQNKTVIKNPTLPVGGLGQ